MMYATLKQLRTLSAVIRHGMISSAAQELNLTAPALTIQMRLLQEAVGLPLVERRKGELRPTTAGAAVLAAAHKIEAALADCTETLDRLRGLEAGRVGVGIVSTAKYFVPQALGAFSKLNPKIELDIVVGNRKETVDHLADFACDLVIMGQPPEHLPIAKALIGAHPHVIVAAPGHRLRGRRGIEPVELAGETFIVRETGSGTRTLMERYAAASKIELHLGMQMSSNETIKQAVMADLGIAFISAHTIAAEVAQGRLVILDVAGLPMMRQWYVARRTDRPLLPATEALWDFLVEQGERFLPRVAEKQM